MKDLSHQLYDRVKRCDRAIEDYFLINPK
jgi:hypothetical protein